MSDVPMISYGEHPEGGEPTFARVCPNCCRFVKADEEVTLYWVNPFTREPNADCSRCGRVEMPLIGFF